jgi:hypothetical protein
VVLMIVPVLFRSLPFDGLGNGSHIAG